MTRSIEIRLLEHQSPDGEILGEDALRLVGAVKDLVYRLTRVAAERPGLGRAPSVIERLSTLRLTVLPGSTRVIFRVGESEALDVDPLEDRVDAAFWHVVEGISANVAPPDIHPSVAEAVQRLVVALEHAAPRVEVLLGAREVALDTRSLVASVWSPSKDSTETERVVTGLLEAVDLRSARFRLLDAAGNRIELVDVQDSSLTAHLVGTRVVARGMDAGRSQRASFRLDSPVVTAADSPVPTSLSDQPSLTEALRMAALVPAPEPIQLSTDELGDFVAAARG